MSAAVTETLEYETAHFLLSLFCNDLGLLRSLEKATGVRVTTRDAWIKFQGDTHGVAAAKNMMQQLENARRKGTDINEHFFRFALASAMDGGKTDATTLEDLTKVKLLGSARKPPVFPKTKGQLAYLHAMEENEVVFGVGPAGTGKTYLAMAKALAALKAGEVQRIILTRPAVEAGEALGFLPGDLNEKILPYLRPLYDAIYDMVEPEEVDRMIEKGTIEIAPLAFMRGRTLSKSFIVLDEAQNTTQSQMFMFLTRLGLGSRYVITGDPSQIDLKDPRGSGLAEALRALEGVPGIQVVQFEGGDVVRHHVVARIITAYAKHREQKQAAREKRNFNTEPPVPAAPAAPEAKET
jgi:phosphate starvation-inducible protein PhoH and related proteins